MSAMFDKAREAAAEGGLQWSTGDIRCVLIDTALYTVDLANHEFLSSVPAGARIGTPFVLTAKTRTAGVLDAGDPTFTGLVGAPSLEAVLFYRHTGSDATAPLLLWVDTATGLPTAAGVTDVTLILSNGANKICKI